MIFSPQPSPPSRSAPTGVYRHPEPRRAGASIHVLGSGARFDQSAAWRVSEARLDNDRVLVHESS